MSAGLEQRVLRRLRALRLATGAPIVVGFSGGGDSLALKALLDRLSRVAACRIVAVHVDHGLRPESAAQAEQVVEFGDRLGVSVWIERVTVDLVRCHPGVGVEEAARRERYAAFGRVARREGAAMVAVAHHEDDQAETVLLHLLRGAGVRGARGMVEVTPLRVPWWEKVTPADAWSGTLWRPFLAEPRSVVRSYVAALGMAIIDDESNSDDRYRRNAVRAHVLPLLNVINPGATATLARYATLAAADDDALAGVVEERFLGVVDGDNNMIRLALNREPVGIRRRLIRRWLDLATDVAEIGANRIEAIVALAEQCGSDRTVELGQNASVVVLGDRLIVGAATDLVRRVADDYTGPLFDRDEDDDGLLFDLPFWTTIGSFQIRVVSGVQQTDRATSDPRRAIVQHDGGKLRLRPPLAGDTWAVSGRKLRHWLANQSVSTLIRERVVCLASDAGVHWVAGLPLPAFERTDENAAPCVTATVIEEMPTCSETNRERMR